MTRQHLMFLSLLFVMISAGACGSKSNDATRVDQSDVRLYAPGQDEKRAKVSDVFVEKLVDHSVAQLAGAEAAIKSAASEQVVDLAYSVKVDYERVLKEMQVLSSQYGWGIPDKEMLMKQVEAVQEPGAEGQNFDNAYIRQVQTAHEQLVTEFERQLQLKGLPVQLAIWLETSLVMLNRHIATCKRISSGSDTLP